MKILVLGGFLGSGKTSVLLQLAGYIGDTTQGDIKLAVIENEIGEVSIDSLTVGGSGLTVKSISSGCVCCTLSTDLVSGLREIQDKLNPKWVIIEATGLAYPDKAVELIKQYVETEAVITAVVADAERWFELHDILRPLVRGQIRSADAILLNKTDLADTAELEQITLQLREINADAEIFRISAHEKIEGEVFSRIIGRSGINDNSY